METKALRALRVTSPQLAAFPAASTVLAEISPDARALLLKRPELLAASAVVERGLGRVLDATSAAGLFPASRKLFTLAVELGNVKMAKKLSGLLNSYEGSSFFAYERDGNNVPFARALEKGDRPMLRWMTSPLHLSVFDRDIGHFAEYVARSAPTREIAEELFAQVRPSRSAMVGALLVPEIYHNGLFEWIVGYYPFDRNYWKEDTALLERYLKRVASKEIKALVWLVDVLGLSREDQGTFDLLEAALFGDSLLILQYVTDRFGVTLKELATKAHQRGTDPSAAGATPNNPEIRAWLDEKFGSRATTPAEARRMATLLPSVPAPPPAYTAGGGRISNE